MLFAAADCAILTRMVGFRLFAVLAQLIFLFFCHGADAQFLQDYIPNTFSPGHYY